METPIAAPKDAPAAVTMGDPAGIGPDIAISSWLQRAARGCPAFFTVGDPEVYAERAAGQCRIETITQPAEAQAVFARALPVLPLERPLTRVIAGSPNTAHAAAIVASIETAVALTLTGQASAVVTAPIAKHVLLQQGFAHAGHTEFLAELARRRSGVLRSASSFLAVMLCFGVKREVERADEARARQHGDLGGLSRRRGRRGGARRAVGVGALERRQ